MRNGESNLTEHSREWFDIFYSVVDPHRSGVSSIEQRRYKQVLDVLDLGGNFVPKSILDIGCGEGHFLKLVKSKYENSSLCGYDISQKALERAKEKVPSARLECIDLKEPGISRKEHDLVFLMEILSAFDVHQLKVLNFAFDCVAPGGFLVVTQRARSDWPLSLVKYHGRDFEITFYGVFAPDVISKSVLGHVILARRRLT